MSPIQVMPYFGRAWKFTLSTPGGTVSVSNNPNGENLRATFHIQTQVNVQYWTCDLTIWNLNPSTTQLLTAQDMAAGDIWQFYKKVGRGDVVTISAGYAQTQGAGAPAKTGLTNLEAVSKYSFQPEDNVIFIGEVLQPIWTRENVTDYKLTLRCTTALIQNTLSNVNTSLPPGVTAYDAVAQIIKVGNLKIDQSFNAINRTALEKSLFPRGQAFFGRPLDLLKGIAHENNLQFWVSPRGVQMRTLDFDSAQPPDWAYGPPGIAGTFPNGVTTGIVKHTLIGTPEQTQMGIKFRVLLDAQPLIGDTVGLVPGTLVNAFQFNVAGPKPVPTWSGIWMIIGLSYTGDTRGNDWYTDVTAVTAFFFPEFETPSTKSVSN